MVVFRKILSTMVRFFVKFNTDWPLCIPSVVSTLAGNRSQSKAAEISIHLQHLNEQQLILALDFCQLLLDETQSGKLSSFEELQVNEQLRYNIPALSQLLSFCSRLSFGLNVLEHVFKTYSLYGSYPVVEAVKTEDNMLPVTAFIFSILEKCENDVLTRNALDEVTTVLEKNPGFYSGDMKMHLAKILIKRGRPLIEAIIIKNNEIEKNSASYTYSDDDMEELEEFTKLFARTTVALCEAELKHPKHLNSDPISILFEYLLVISNFPGTPYVDHNITMDVLEFWNTYVDSFEEEPYTSESNPILLQVIEVFWKKSVFSPLSRTGWDHDMREAFDSYRRDFWDFLESSYSLVGSTLFSTLVNNISENLLSNNIDWLKIEASLSCISTLADSVTVSNEYDLLCQLLSSDLLSKAGYVNDINVQMTIISFVGSYDTFFEMDTGRPFLFEALNFLFKSLAVNSLANSTSKSIIKLCSSNRDFLSDNFQSFFDTYVSMKLYKRLDNIPHQRTVLAISSVAQPLQDPETQANYISQLFDVITLELESECELYYQSFEDQILTRIVSLLKCIASIGKGLQEPDDTLESDTDTSSLHARFWESNKQGIRSRVIKVINTISAHPCFSSRIDINEACCDILKTGFLEHIPGPFVFSADTVVQFIKTKCIFDQSFPVIAEFSCSFVTSYALKNAQDPIVYTNALIDGFFPFTSSCLSGDPEAQATFLKLHHQMMQLYMDSFVQNSHALDIIKYATFLFSSQERFVLRESSRLWATILKSPDEHLIPHVTTLGPSLVRVLAQKLSGDSLRSELDCYIEVIKPLMQRHSSNARMWLNNAFLDEPSPLVEKIPINQRQLIIQQLVSLKGSKQTSIAVREFWLKSRGITDYT